MDQVTRDNTDKRVWSSFDAYNALVQSVKLVASDADVQIASLPSFVVVCDEIALTYDGAFRSREFAFEYSDVPSETKQLLGELDELFSAMSDDKSLWTIKQLLHGKSWERARSLARSILAQLGVDYGDADVGFGQYLPG